MKEEITNQNGVNCKPVWLLLREKAGDGAGGGGIALAGTWWDKEALAIAEQVCLSFNGELGIYAFKTLLNGTIRVRIERLTNK